MSQIFFNEEIQSNKRVQKTLILALASCLISAVLVFVKSIIVDRAALRRESVSCVPVDQELTFPLVYHQTSANPVNTDALVKTFILEYISLTQDENYINYHATTDNSRYDEAKLSEGLWKALEMSVGIEKALIQKKYADSVDTFKFLKANNVGWVFLPDAILINSLPEAGSYRVVVRGEFQITYDKAKIDVPHGLLGYKEITYVLVQADPTEDRSGEPLNKSGLFVAYSQVEDLDPMKRSEYYKKDFRTFLDKKEGF